ncbi:MAG: HNH endonuclease [Galactobacter sp.]
MSVSPVGERKVARNGYMTVKLESGKWELEHRLVMESHLGRPLIDAENVHHINGDRLDNRLKNLELWSDRQPKGQRVDDKIEFALEILRLYKPESLSA